MVGDEHAADGGGDELRPGERGGDGAQLRCRNDDWCDQPDEHDVKNGEFGQRGQRHAAECADRLLFLQAFADEQAEQHRVDGVAQRDTRNQREKSRADAEQIRAERRDERDGHARPDAAEERRDGQHQIDARAGHELAEASGEKLKRDQKCEADGCLRDPGRFFHENPSILAFCPYYSYTVQE